MFLLPLQNQATRKILEGSPHCDIYTQSTPLDQTSLMDGFLRFIEGWLNKIRRPQPNKNWVFFPPLFLRLEIDFLMITFDLITLVLMLCLQLQISVFQKKFFFSFVCRRLLPIALYRASCMREFD